MNDAEKDRHISMLEGQLAAVETKIGELNVKVTALYRLFLEEDPSDPDSKTKAKRIMSAVQMVEKMSWGSKTLVYLILTCGSVFAAFKAMGIGWK